MARGSTTTTNRVNWRDNPRARVTHYAHSQDERQPGGVANTQRELITNNNSDVLSFTFTKDTNSPTGHCVIQLAARQDYIYGPNRIKVDDLLFIEAEANDGLTQRETQQQRSANIITLLLVDNITRGIKIDSEGRELPIFNVSCSDFGKVLENTAIVPDSGVAQAIGSGALIGTSAFGESFIKIFGASANAGGAAFTPNQAVVNLFNVVLAASTQQWVLPNDQLTFQALVDPWTYVQKIMLGATLVTNPFGLDVNTTLWGLMKQYSNEFLNELFVDVRYEDPDEAVGPPSDRAKVFIEQNLGGVAVELQDTRPFRQNYNRNYPLSLVMRQRPYDADAFNALPAVQVYSTECFDLTESLASHEIFNVFRVWGLQVGATIYGEHFEYLVNKESIRRHGVRRFEPETIYTFPTLSAADDYSKGQTQSVTPQQLVSLYQKIIAIWNNANENLAAGTIVCRFRPDIRVGMRLVLTFKDSSRLEGYIQTVTHQYDAQGDCDTTISFVRGIRYDAAGNNILNVVTTLDASLDDLGITDADTFTTGE